jgi:hypothetical protein
MLDIFKSDAFSVTSLTDAINKIKFVPGQVGASGLFTSTSVSTLSIVLEEKNGILSLVPRSGRGAPGTTLDKSQRTARSFIIPHFEIDDAIMADEVQGVRAWGSETQTETVMGKVGERLAIHSQSLDATEEYARIGAIKGTITYADGGTMSLFTEFGVSAQTEVDFNLDAASPASGILRQTCAAVVRTIQDELDGTPLQGVKAYCSAEFYDALIAHPEVRDTYLGYIQAADLRGGYAYGSFTFGGITFEEYRGSVGGQRFVEANKAYFFPIGAPGLFRTYYAPADYIETVNTMGMARYAKQYPMDNGKGINLEVQTNALSLCTRPRALVKGKLT